MWLRFVRWLVVLLGGTLLGAGLVLHGQVAMARHMKNEVDRTFFLWREVGKATYWFQGDDVRMALAMAETPDEAVDASDRAAWVLVVLGAIAACSGPLIRGHGGAKGAGKPSGKSPAKSR